jgi:hypothetical protein
MHKAPTAAMLVLAAGLATAAETNVYRVALEPHIEGRMLSIAPEVEGPAGARVRYEIISVRQGPSGLSTTRQSGGATLDGDGRAGLSTLRLGIAPTDRYLITVTVRANGREVARETLQYPD